ncbi:endolytic transglycosylase MltG [Terrabacter aerolatus]|uniref:Endolytic murein transglycosylase n=1 Tax=Terrabacter aerolatus TaxID=422442 RepID=A0A512D4S5_9MICO|nr:endolytic transglycosylase MltG [Terrabacter aerolatus]GEO31449.1 ABC transporter substrate-binding protein [Terrabacter aerolatus]
MKDHLESSIFGDHEDTVEHLDHVDDVNHLEETHAAPPLSRRELREQELASRKRGGRRSGRRGKTATSGVPRGKPSVFRRLVVIVLALAVIGGGVAVAYKALRPVVEGFLESNDYPGPGTGEVRVTIDAGSGGTAIAKALVDADVVKSTKAFVDAANNDPRSAGIQPGVYTMKKQMKASDALAFLVDPKNRLITRVVIPEGLWADEIYDRLSKVSGIPVDQYVAASKQVDQLGLPPSAKGNIEGYLFPASYEFGPTSTALDQLKQMVAESTKRLDALQIPPDQMERVVTIASLVEGEAQNDADRSKVARVVENRLAAKMSLGFDSSVNYIFKKRGVPTQQMLDSSNPYNTRRFPGLPPGPISNPGDSALKAAANPVAGPWLYFVTVNLDTGETKFAATYAEHQRNVAEFQKWCADNKGKC